MSPFICLRRSRNLARDFCSLAFVSVSVGLFVGNVIVRRLVLPSNAGGALSAHFNRSVSEVYTHNVLPKPTDSNDVSEENAIDLIGRSL